MQPNPERCRRKAAECDRIASRLHDDAARRIFRRTAVRWRTMADDSDERLAQTRLAHLVRMLAPRPDVEG